MYCCFTKACYIHCTDKFKEIQETQIAQNNYVFNLYLSREIELNSITLVQKQFT